jgi:hypothetical protein
VRKLKDKETVVFHCALSQMRGPGAALRYLRERERLLGAGSKIGSAGDTQDAKAGQKEEGGKEGEGEQDADGEWEDVEDEPREQKVYVLDEGFVGWVQRFAEDPRLTEGYRKEIWKDGYY